MQADVREWGEWLGRSLPGEMVYIAFQLAAVTAAAAAAACGWSMRQPKLYIEHPVHE